MWGKSLESQQWYRLRRSVLLGWVVSGREARRPAAKMMERTCSMDARGQTAIGHQEVSPTDSYCAVQHTTLAQCVHTFFFSPCLLMQGALLLPNHRHVLKSRQKLEPEGESGGEREIEEERGVIESLHKAHLSRVRQQGVPYGLYISRHTHP